MPACYEEALCKDNSLPLNGRHSCGACDSELHGFCGSFYNEDSIKSQNICTKCRIALDRKNHDLTNHGLPPLPFPLTPQEVVQLVPEITKRLESELVAQTAKQPDPEQPTISVSRIMSGRGNSDPVNKRDRW